MPVYHVKCYETVNFTYQDDEAENETLRKHLHTQTSIHMKLLQSQQQSGILKKSYWKMTSGTISRGGSIKLFY